MLSHKNLIHMGVALQEVDPLEPTDDYLSFLPLAWIGEQMMTVGMGLTGGFAVNFPEEVETAMSDLKEIGPHVMFSPPRVWEGIQSRIWVDISESYRFNRWVYERLLKIGYRAADYRMRGRPMPLSLRIAYAFAHAVLFRPLKDRLGFLRLRRAYTGGAALGPDVFRFFHAIGVNLKQIYGQTEITGIAYVHRDGDVRYDTVGKPIPGTEVQISEEGEILSRSDAVCLGYYKRPDATAELLEGGWLHSGDAGYLTEDGHLVVIDRLSDVMHTASGEMFSPQFSGRRTRDSPTPPTWTSRKSPRWRSSFGGRSPGSTRSLKSPSGSAASCSSTSFSTPTTTSSPAPARCAASSCTKSTPTSSRPCTRAGRRPGSARSSSTRTARCRRWRPRFGSTT